MKNTREMIKTWSFRDWLVYYSPRPIRYIGDAYDNLPAVQSYNEKYAEVNRIEKELTDLDQKYSIWIVTNKDYMWT